MIALEQIVFKLILQILLIYYAIPLLEDNEYWGRGVGFHLMSKIYLKFKNLSSSS